MTFLSDVDDSFAVTVDWTLFRYFDGLVFVELELEDDDFTIQLSHHKTILNGIAYAKKYLSDRGYDYFCDIDTHQRRDDTHLTFYPKKRKTPRVYGTSIMRFDQRPLPLEHSLESSE